MLTLREARERAGLGRYTTARRAGFDVKVVKRLEGRPVAPVDDFTWLCVCEAIGVSPDEVVRPEPPPKPKARRPSPVSKQPEPEAVARLAALLREASPTRARLQESSGIVEPLRRVLRGQAQRVSFEVVLLAAAALRVEPAAVLDHVMTGEPLDRSRSFAGLEPAGVREAARAFTVWLVDRGAQTLGAKQADLFDRTARGRNDAYPTARALDAFAHDFVGQSLAEALQEWSRLQCWGQNTQESDS